MPKRNVSFVKPPEPAFLRRLKERIGYQEGPTVETKRETLQADDVGDDFDDEKPMVVVLKPGDLTAEEAEEIEKEESGISGCASSEKISFQKPVKRVSSEKPNPLMSSSSKKSKRSLEKKETQKDATKSVKNSSLLSFDEEDEDD